MPRASVHESSDAVCPFYRFEKGRALHCEGIYSKGIIQTFNTNEDKKRHKHAYCYKLDGCKKCLIYKGIDSKYGRW